MSGIIPYVPLKGRVIVIADLCLQHDALPLGNSCAARDAHRRGGEDECGSGRIGRGGVLRQLHGDRGVGPFLGIGTGISPGIHPGLLDRGLLLSRRLGRLFLLCRHEGRFLVLIEHGHAAELDRSVPEDEDIFARLLRLSGQIEVVCLAILIGGIELRLVGGRLARPLAADLIGDPDAVPAVGHMDLLLAHLGFKALGQSRLVEDHGVPCGLHKADLGLFIHDSVVKEDDVFQLEAAAGKVDLALVGIDHVAQAQSRTEAGEPLGREGQITCQCRGRKRQHHQQRERQGDPFFSFHGLILSESRRRAGLS